MKTEVTQVKEMVTITTTLPVWEIEALQKVNEKFCLKEIYATMLLLKILDLKVIAPKEGKK